MQTINPRTGAPIAAVFFEPYGTLLDIETDERDWYAYLNLSRFLEYRGVRLSADELRWLWFEKIARQVVAGDGPYPEIDVRAAWRELVNGNRKGCHLPSGFDFDTFLSDLITMHRALTRRTLRLMEGVRPLLESLSASVRLGIVTDSQPDYILPELHLAGISRFFDTVVISGQYGYRKPDARLFQTAVSKLSVPPEQALFVGVDTGRDMAGARAAGLRSALLLTPYGTKDIALGEPDHVLDTVAELSGLLAQLIGS